MPGPSPLPQRLGLDPAWLRTPGDAPHTTLRDHLASRLALEADHLDAMIADGRFVDDHGHVVTATEPYRPHIFVWFHRDLPEEAEVPFEVDILHRDERIVVVDKPHFLSTIPRGRHIRQSVLVRLRAQLGLPELGAAHRLDRQTAGVLLLTTQRRWRAPYQQLFEHRLVEKGYEALAPVPAGMSFPRTVRSHIVKDRGVLQAYEVTGREPNAVTEIELVEQRDGIGRFALRPLTGKTHQLRLHLLSLGAPILGDPLYPRVRDVDLGDFSEPMQLLARELAYTDPVDGTVRRHVSGRTLPWP